jgi:hypothetical protein
VEMARREKREGNGADTTGKERGRGAKAEGNRVSVEERGIGENGAVEEGQTEEGGRVEITGGGVAEKKAREERERMDSPVYKAKLFGEALRGTLPMMPNDAIDLISWLRSVEQLILDFKVSDNLKVHLLKPHSTEQARTLIARMNPDEASRYDDVKRMLLHEFKLSSSALLDRFNGLIRNPSETFTLYGNRLKSVLTYYVESRKAERFDLLLELLICYRIK